MDELRQFPPIAGDGNAKRFELRCDPNGVYRVDGRVIPVAHDSTEITGSVDYGEPIIRIHNPDHLGIGLCGSVLGVNVEK